MHGVSTVPFVQVSGRRIANGELVTPTSLTALSGTATHSCRAPCASHAEWQTFVDFLHGFKDKESLHGKKRSFAIVIEVIAKLCLLQDHLP